jgi:hypothetical protein
MLSITIAMIIGLGVFGILWWYTTWDAHKLWRGAPLTFTPTDSRGNLVPFEPRHERYMKVAEVVTTLASASLVFVPKSGLNVYPNSCAFALVLLGFVVLYCVGFMAALTYFYERFLYFPDSYSPCKYGLANALGFGGLFCFVTAYTFLAVRVAWALVYTTSSVPKP